MAGLYAPLPTLRRRPRGRLRAARGRCGSLLLHRSGLSPHTPCRSPGALTRVAARTLAPSPIRVLLHRTLQPFRHLHDCSGCFRLERSPGGACTHWKAPPSHGAHVKRPFCLSVQTRAAIFAQTTAPANRSARSRCGGRYDLLPCILRQRVRADCTSMKSPPKWRVEEGRGKSRGNRYRRHGVPDDGRQFFG